MDMKKKLCIYISSPSSYSDIFNIFIRCFEKKWRDCSYPIVISTDCKKELSEKYDVRLIDSKYNNWVTRTIECLKQIDYEYILLMMDDALIMNSVDESLIEEIVFDMDRYNIDYCKLTAAKKGLLYKDSRLLNIVSKETPYAKNIFMGIYRRSFLLNELGDGSLSAWDIEKKWLDESKNAIKGDFFDNVVLCNRVVINAPNAVIGGKWFPSIKKKIIKMGIPIESERESVSRIQEIKMNTGAKLGNSLPPRMRRGLKKMLAAFGMSFATEK